MKQLNLFKPESKSYGGELLRTRKGRCHGRPLDTRRSMHLVLRSSKAKGEWSFLRPKNRAAIQMLVKKFSGKYGVRVLSCANVGNHLHFHIQLTNRHTYRPFIRALTGAIAMAVTGVSRWRPNKFVGKFWDYRPFTRVVVGFRAVLRLKDYIAVNRWEARGYNREAAGFILQTWGMETS